MPTYDPEYAPSQPDPLLTHRTERTWVDVLTLGDRLRGRLIGVEVSGSIEFNVNRTIRGGGVHNAVAVGYAVGSRYWR